MKYTFRTKPYPHQVRALRKLLKTSRRKPVRGGGLQVPMRWGKTKVGVDFAGCMHLLEGIRRVLVITVTDGIEVWHNEIRRHSSIPWFIPALGGFKPNGFMPGASGGLPEPDGIVWHVINFQNVFYRENTGGRSWVPVDHPDLVAFVREGDCLVIVDEAHHIGTPTGVMSKHAYRLGQMASCRMTMTGTMFHRKPFYVFGQIKFLDPFIFGTNWGNFKSRIAVMGGASGYEVLRYKNLKWMMRKVRPWVYMEKYVPPGKPVINIIPAPLHGANATAYAKMERDSIVKLDNGDKVTADIVLTKHLRLQQIAGGWARTENGYRRVGRCKLDIAESRLREYMEQDITKAVVGCRFLPELRDLRDVAKKIGFRPIVFHGGLERPARVHRIAAFQRLDEPCLFITQHRAARESIDLSAASVMMLYSLPEGFLTYDQFIRRIELFDDKRTLMYDIIMASDTRDEVAWEALQQSQDVATYILTNPARVERIVAANTDERNATRRRT